MLPLDPRTSETPLTVWIKRVAAVGLAMAFFLPLTSCTGRDYSASSAYEWPGIGACVGLLLFFWPIGFEVAAGLKVQTHPVLRRPGLRIALVVCTVIGISWLVYWGQQVRYGAFVAYLSSFSYGAVLWALVTRSRKAVGSADRVPRNFPDGR